MPRLIDLSHAITPQMTLFPGTPAPVIAPLAAIATDGFAEQRLTLTSHTGTHVDAPAHLIAGAATLDVMPLRQFVGPALCIDVRHVADRRIGTEPLAAHATLIDKADFVVFHSGWSQRWARADYLDGFPLLSEDAARWLVGARLKGIGIDMISVDDVASAALPIHQILLGAGLLIIENLTRLDPLPTDRLFEFSCFPLPLTHADGSPVRAVARV